MDDDDNGSGGAAIDIETTLSHCAVPSRQKQHRSARDRLNGFLFPRGTGSLSARLYHYFLDGLVMASMLTLCLASLPTLSDDAWEGQLWYGLETFVAIVFILDLLLKLGSTIPTIRYVKSWVFAADVLSVVPWITETVFWSIKPSSSESAAFHRLSVLRVLRLLRFARCYSVTFSSFPDMLLFVQALKQSRLAITFLLLFVAFSAVFFSSILYYIETGQCHIAVVASSASRKRILVHSSDQLPCSFQSIFDAIWFVMVTITTVGYGDVQVRTATGKVVTVFMMICAFIGFSLPVAIFGANLTELYLGRRLNKKRPDSANDHAKLSDEEESLRGIAQELTAIRKRLEAIIEQKHHQHDGNSKLNN